MKFVFINLLLSFIIALLSQDAKGQDLNVVVLPFMENQVKQFPNVRDVTLSGDGNEVYFTAQSHLSELSAIVTTRKIGGKWAAMQVAPFSGQYMDMEPFLTPNGLKLFFVSNRPNHADSTHPKDFDIWMVERTTVNDIWSRPMNIGAPVNSEENEFYPSIAASGNLYFTSDGKGSKGKDDIFISKIINGKYQSPQNLSDSVNSTGYEFNAMIAPDESWLLFTCYNREGGYGSGDLYISYHNDDHWTAPINLGKEINSPQMDYCPFVNLNTGITYFTSKRTSVKDHFEQAQSIKKFKEEMEKYDNGQSRLYQIQISDFNKWNPLKK